MRKHFPVKCRNGCINCGRGQVVWPGAKYHVIQALRSLAKFFQPALLYQELQNAGEASAAETVLR